MSKTKSTAETPTQITARMARRMNEMAFNGQTCDRDALALDFTQKEIDLHAPAARDLARQTANRKAAA